MRRCYSSLSACLVPRACLPRIVSRHPSDADGGGGLLSVGSADGLLACLSRCIHAVPFLVSSLGSPSHGSFD